MTHPYDGRVVGTVSVPTEAQVEEALRLTAAVAKTAAATPLHFRVRKYWSAALHSRCP